MKKFFLLVLSAIVVAIIMNSCATAPTESAGNAYGSMSKQANMFTTRQVMEKRPLKVPNDIDEERLGALPFAIGLRQNKDVGSNDNLSKREFDKLSQEFESIISASKRFPLAQAYYGLADNTIRRAASNGAVKVRELDYEKMKTAENIINVTATLTKTYFQKGRDATETYALSLDCMPVNAETNEPLDWFESFQLLTKKEIHQRVTAQGIVTQGIDTTSKKNRESIQMDLFRKDLVLLIARIYNNFPAGGKVTDFDLQSKAATVKASRSTGLLPNMQMVIYARTKGNSDAMRVALFNADLATCGKTGTSELTIWREAKTDKAKRIIAMIARDWEAAQEEYDFYAASDGIAESPDFIKVDTNVN